MEGQNLPALQIVYPIKAVHPRDALRKRRKHDGARFAVDLAKICFVCDDCRVFGNDLPTFEHDAEVLSQFLRPQLQCFFDALRIIDHHAAIIHIIP